MKKRINVYIKMIDKLLSDANSSTNWNEVLKEHLQQIAFFQHERLVHLIVTMTFAVITILTVGIGLIAQRLTVFILTAMCLALLIPYIRHYYLLENGVQKMYEQYDKILLNSKETKQSSLLQGTPEQV